MSQVETFFFPNVSLHISPTRCPYSVTYFSFQLQLAPLSGIVCSWLLPNVPTSSAIPCRSPYNLHLYTPTLLIQRCRFDMSTGRGKSQSPPVAMLLATSPRMLVLTPDSLTPKLAFFTVTLMLLRSLTVRASVMCATNRYQCASVTGGRSPRKKFPEPCFCGRKKHHIWTSRSCCARCLCPLCRSPGIKWSHLSAWAGRLSLKQSPNFGLISIKTWKLHDVIPSSPFMAWIIFNAGIVCQS